MKKLVIFVLLSCYIYPVDAQNDELVIISNIYKNALSSRVAYTNLKELCEKAKGRMVCSPEAEKAVEILTGQLSTINVDTLFRQIYYTEYWHCLPPGKAVVIYKGKRDTLNVATLGKSISTVNAGIAGEVLEVFSLAELDSLGSEVVKDKIVFFNRPMDNTQLNTFLAYRGAIDQRSYGPIIASQHGAKGVIIRSLATELDDFPHTGVCRYADTIPKIPILSVSTNDAEKLSRIAKENAHTKLWMKCSTEITDSIETCNLIAEIKGSKYPDQVILIGAHMDAWYNTQGAHDDGVGCEQMIDVLRIFNELNIKPDHTIRLVLYMDEEINQSGADIYAKYTGEENIKHIAAIESDAGGFLPVGFAVDAPDSIVDIVRQFAEKLRPYGINIIIQGFAGVDIQRLAKYNVPLIGLMTNSQRYFEIHHCENDTPAMVGRREMQYGTASIASLVYLIDRYGMKK
ncbi:MAG: M28 family peptidase [Bacteroidales bacterium]|nr:M28 family peptidase [Bacteroidales bacterium]